MLPSKQTEQGGNRQAPGGQQRSPSKAVTAPTTASKQPSKRAPGTSGQRAKRRQTQPPSKQAKQAGTGQAPGWKRRSPSEGAPYLASRQAKQAGTRLTQPPRKQAKQAGTSQAPAVTNEMGAKASGKQSGTRQALVTKFNGTRAGLVPAIKPNGHQTGTSGHRAKRRQTQPTSK